MPVATPTGTKLCQHEGCLKNSMYSLNDSPVSVCRDHKRAGMYFSRHGKLWVATQDGEGTRLTGTTTRKTKSSSPTQRSPKQDSNGCHISSPPSTAALQNPSSAEPCQLQNTRRDAHTAGATSSRGTRARAPSRKSLEAAGQIELEGAQLMTKEKRGEEMRRRATQKEQRKATAAAGLKLGVVLEEFTGTATSSPLGVIRGSTSGANSGDTTKDLWRKLTPLETLQEAQRLRAPVNTTHHISNNDLTTDSLKRSLDADGKGYHLAWGHIKKSAKVRGSWTETSKARRAQHGIINRRQREEGLEAPGGGSYSNVPICVFKDCKRPATFGVPGTVVRYCGFHRIFGMAEIIDRTTRQPVHR